MCRPRFKSKTEWWSVGSASSPPLQRLIALIATTSPITGKPRPPSNGSIAVARPRTLTNPRFLPVIVAASTVTDREPPRVAAAPPLGAAGDHPIHRRAIIRAGQGSRSADDGNEAMGKLRFCSHSTYNLKLLSCAHYIVMLGVSFRFGKELGTDSVRACERFTVAFFRTQHTTFILRQ